ncbi:MAG TPA: hypothetical protein VJP79_00195 [Nitrososphaera sp.]|nr:hypothetical protein [Nitrososphaera sp.]
MLFNINPIRSTEQARNEIKKIVARQKKGTQDDLTPFAAEIDKLLLQIEHKPSWQKIPVVARAALIEVGGRVIPYSEDVVLPNTKHDFELVIRMLNHIREQKKLASVNMPLFIQPDEISIAYSEGRFSHAGGKIVSQLSVVVQKGSIMCAGFVFGRDYVILHG